MKMRRTRVRSLLAGCISCLRCVRTSALTCRSSPQCVPPAQQSPPLGSRCLAPLAVITTTGTPGFPQQLSSSSSSDARFRESSLCILELVPRCLSPLRSSPPRLFIAATEPSWTSGSRHAISRPVPCTRVSPAPWRCQKLYLAPPLRCCRRSRQKINEAVTDGNGSGCCVAQRGRFKRARKCELLLLTVSRKH